MKSFKGYLQEQEPFRGYRKDYPQEQMDENILNDVLNIGSKFMYFWKNLWIINTKHGGERIGERNQLTKDQIKLLFKKALDKVSDLGLALNKEVLFFSRSLNQGFVSVVVPEGLKLITFLPKGKSFPKPGTSKMVVEGKEYSFDEIVELDTECLSESVSISILERQVNNILKKLKQEPVGEFPKNRYGYQISQATWNNKPAVRIKWIHDGQMHTIRMARNDRSQFQQIAQKELAADVFDGSPATTLYVVPK